jgi:membrane carboxypeptidase/penicillin-binding protein PbpC
MYLNEAYFGRRAYGIEMASRMYFNKEVEELNIPESAILVALLKSNVWYDPVRRPVAALRRRNLVLGEMFEEGHISRDQFNLFRDEEIVVRFEETSQKYMTSVAPYFVEDVRMQLEGMSKNRWKLRIELLPNIWIFFRSNLMQNGTGKNTGKLLTTLLTGALEPEVIMSMRLHWKKKRKYITD